MSNPQFTAPNYTTQDAATYKANIDASCAANGADSINIGFSYNAGTGVFTVHGSDGTTLSATNPGFVKFQDSSTPGYSKYISVEANQSFIDDNGASEIVGNLFGTTTLIAWGNDCPFYLYAMHSDDQASVAFALGRLPHLNVAPAAASIGAPDDPVADTEGCLFSFDNLDETLYDGNAVTCLGSIRMRKSASDDWTVQTLTAQDGIGKFQEGVLFTMPTNQNGAASGTHYLAGGGTAPTGSTATVTYTVDRSGLVDYGLYYVINNTPSGSVSLQSALPLTADSAASTMGVGRHKGATNYTIGATFPSTKATLQYNTGGTRQLYNGDIASGHILNVVLSYLADVDA